MSPLFAGSRLSLGLDGSLLITPEARLSEIDVKVDEATYVTTEHMADGVGVFARKKLDRDLFSSSLAEVDDDDTLKVKTLAAPHGPASRAVLQKKLSKAKGKDGQRSGGGTRTTSSTAAAAIAAQEAGSARRMKALWEGLEQEKQRLHRLPEGGTQSGAGDGDASMPPPSQSPPQAEHKRTFEDNTPPPLPPMALELGDDVVLRVTNTGSVVVTVDGITAIDLGNPHVTKRKRGLGSRIKDFFGGLRHRRGSRKNDSDPDYIEKRDEDSQNKNNDDQKNRGVDDDGWAIVSDGYTLHAVENGFEVRLEGVFVWGRVL